MIGATPGRAKAFARSGLHAAVRCEIYELTELGVAFVSVSDSIDLTTATGRLLAGILSAIAAFERDLIIERTRFGLQHAKKHGTRSGKAIGRPMVAAARAVEVRALRHQGLSLAAIAERTGLGFGSVQRLLAGVAIPRKPK